MIDGFPLRYGGGPVIARKVVSTGVNNMLVEIRELTLHFVKSSDLETGTWPNNLHCVRLIGHAKWFRETLVRLLL